MPYEPTPFEPLSPDSWRWNRWFSKIVEVGTWTPTFTNLTVVLGGGSVSYSGRWQRVQRMIHFAVTITPAGGATVESTAGSTYHDLPFAPSFPACSITSDVTALSGIGTGVITTNGRNYLPTKSATTDTLVITGAYEY